LPPLFDLYEAVRPQPNSYQKYTHANSTEPGTNSTPRRRSAEQRYRRGDRACQKARVQQLDANWTSSDQKRTPCTQPSRSIGRQFEVIIPKLYKS